MRTARNLPVQATSNVSFEKLLPCGYKGALRHDPSRHLRPRVIVAATSGRMLVRCTHFKADSVGWNVPSFQFVVDHDELSRSATWREYGLRSAVFSSRRGLKPSARPRLARSSPPCFRSRHAPLR